MDQKTLNMKTSLDESVMNIVRSSAGFGSLSHGRDPHSPRVKAKEGGAIRQECMQHPQGVFCDDDQSFVPYAHPEDVVEDIEINSRPASFFANETGTVPQPDGRPSLIFTFSITYSSSKASRVWTPPRRLRLTVSHPYLQTLDRHSVNEFLKARASYHMMRREALAKKIILPDPKFLDCIDGNILRDLNRKGCFGGVTGVEEVPESDVDAALWQEIKDLELDLSEKAELRELIKEKVELNLDEKNPTYRIKELCSDFVVCLKQAGALLLIESQPTLAIGMLVGLLEPLELRNHIDHWVSFSKSELLEDWVDFLSWLEEEAVEYEKYI